jgi:uncharacterized membrane protein YbhN (UPF0104 family)
MNPPQAVSRTSTQERMRKRLSRIRRWLGPAVAIVVLAAVLWRLGTGPFLEGVRAVDVRALLAASAIVLGTTLCSAWRWTIVARGLGVPLSFRAAVAAYYRAVFLNLTLPTGIAGDVQRGLEHGREVRQLGRAFRAVVWERGAGQAVQAALTIAVLLVLPSPVHSAMRFVAPAVAALGIGLVLVARARSEDDGSRWARVRNAAVGDICDGVLTRSALPAILATSIVVVLGHAATFLLAARTAGVTAPVERLLPLALLALLAMVLPSFAGWGPREGATAWVFAAAGLGAGRGAAAAVAYGVLVLAASLPGALLLVLARLPHPRPPRWSGFREGATHG